jgi:hypothetical protein
MDQHSLVGIATRYGADGPGIEYRWGRGFCTRPDREWDPHRPVEWALGGVKLQGRGVDHPPPSIAGVKERVELSLRASSVSSWQVNFIYLFHPGRLRGCSLNVP